MKKYRKSLKKLYRRSRRWLLGGRQILILGDSHCGVFEHVFDTDLWPPHLINCEIVGGGTAFGLLNDRSLTRAFARFDAALRRFAAADVIVVMLGEVDCGFVLWQKARKDGVDPFALVDRSMAGYRRLLDAIFEHHAGRAKTVVLAGAILPTVKDACIPVQESDLRRSVEATQAERTGLVLFFNERLRQLAAEYRVSYIDITPETLDPATGLVSEACLLDARDHHQSPAVTASLWVKTLKGVI